MATVQVMRGSRPEWWDLECTGDLQGNVLIRLVGPGGDTWTARGPIVWEAMKTLRLEGEARGLRLCCNGARIDAYPSRMGISMGGGEKVNLLRKGHSARRRDLVEIFGRAPADKIGTVAEQEQFYNEWLASLR